MRKYILVACLWLATNALDAKIVFRSSRDGEGSEIYTMNADGSNQARITYHPTNVISATWSPNGQQIVFDARPEGGRKGEDFTPCIWTIDADGKNLRQLTFPPDNLTGWGDAYPYWSPDGSQIAFCSDRDWLIEGEPPKNEIYVMDTDGSNMQPITDVGFASQPRWSPDGEWILFVGMPDQVRHIYAIRPDGTEMWQISAPIPETAMNLGGWSPDGKRVVYGAYFHSKVTNMKMIIASLHLVGRTKKVFKREEVPLPKMPEVTGRKTISFGADGKSILFAGRIFGSWEVYRFRLDTRELIQLTNAPTGGDTSPREWNPQLPVSFKQETLPLIWGAIKSK